MLDEKRKKEIMESTDPSMDEMGYVVFYNPEQSTGGGKTTKSMTKREALLNGYDESRGQSEPWISYREDAEHKRNEEQRKEEERKAKEQRKKEIMESTDPSMDEMGTIIVSQMDNYYMKTSKGLIHINKRDFLLGNYDGNLESYWISDEDSKKEIIQRCRTLDSILNDEDPFLDEPLVYTEVVDYIPQAYHPKPIYGPVIHTRREINAKIASRGMDGYAKEGSYWNRGTEPISEEEKKLAEEFKKKVNEIKNGNSPELDKKGIITLGNNPVETTLRQAMLASPGFDVTKIGFKTYEQIDKEQQDEEKRRIEREKNEQIIMGREEQEKREQETEKEEPKSKITFSSIKNAIKKALGKESR